MKKLTPVLAAVLCMAVVFATAPTTANAISPPWDHYVCYVAKDTIKPAQLPPAVGLQDQFTQGNYKVGKAKFLCPPASKNAEPTFDLVTHLKIYPIKRLKPGKDQLPPHGVQVDNQFGQQVLKVGATTGLMVPTTKSPAGPPPPPNPNAYSYEHYKCYKATGKPLKLPVQLVDQFGGGPAVVVKAMQLCNPAAKLHNGAIDPIRIPDRHLVCYGIKSKLKPPVAGPWFAANQFGLEQLKVGAAKTLCVPSLKQVLP